MKTVKVRIAVAVALLATGCKPNPSLPYDVVQQQIDACNDKGRQSTLIFDNRGDVKTVYCR